MGLLKGLLRSGACVSQSWANPVVFDLPHAGYLRVLRTRDWLPLEEVFTATRGAALIGDSNTSPAFYAQAWALVHYLKLGHRGRDGNQLTAFMARVAQGIAPLRAAQESFGDLVVLERALRPSGPSTSSTHGCPCRPWPGPRRRPCRWNPRTPR